MYGWLFVWEGDVRVIVVCEICVCFILFIYGARAVTYAVIRGYLGMLGMEEWVILMGNGE